MRDWAQEKERRVAFIKKMLASSGAKGVVFGNSGGKDSALVAALCSFATDNVLGVIMPCHSKRNFGEDKEDGLAVAEKYGVETMVVDLTEVREKLLAAVGGELTAKAALANIAPRLRMTTLYAIGAEKGYLVAGTGNKSERYMGYFTKWGDGACDFNPIADLCATEIFDFLRYLGAPDHVVNKAPSAGLFEGQTDESEMGVTYAEIDAYLRGEKVSPEAQKIIERYHKASLHKMVLPPVFPED
ncbi:MAG TPA: NAD(+) synthase [Clostridiales bacterium]|nr:NAD(+) synthase [Clostridiales bacterium]